MKRTVIQIISLAFILACSKSESPSPIMLGTEMDDLRAPRVAGVKNVNWAWRKQISYYNDYFVDHTAYSRYRNLSSGSSDVGALTLNNINLLKSPYEYFYLPPTDGSEELNLYNKDCYWTIKGNNSYPRLDFIDDSEWPKVGDILYDSTLRKSSQYTVALEVLENADSVIIRLGYDAEATIRGDQYSYTFQHEELKNIDPGPDGTIRIYVDAYRLTDTTYAGMKLHFGKLVSKETSLTEQITVLP